MNWILIDRIKEWRRQYPQATLIIWSSESLEEAEKVAEESDLESIIDACIMKPDCLVGPGFSRIRRQRADLSVVDQGAPLCQDA